LTRSGNTASRVRKALRHIDDPLGELLAGRQLCHTRGRGERTWVVQSTADNDQFPLDDRRGWGKHILGQLADHVPLVGLGIVFENIADDIPRRLGVVAASADNQNPPLMDNRARLKMTATVWQVGDRGPLTRCRIIAVAGRDVDLGDVVAKALQRRRSEVVERTFAHICETGGSRRSHLRGLVNVTKRYLIAVAAHNLGRILRQLTGIGKPRCLQGGAVLATLA
jgi:Transposase DDE domain